MKTKFMAGSFASMIVLAVGSVKAFAQTQDPTATILHLDSAFWITYNSCDTAHFKDFFTDDVEFYHDKGGVTLNARSLIESLNTNICGIGNPRLRREAVAGTVKVYSMRNNNEIYGAIISGEHNFYLTEKGKPEYQSGTANFTDLWLLKNGNWRMARVLSYNHHAPEYVNKRKEIELPAPKLDRLAGRYKSNQFGAVTVARQNNILQLLAGKDSLKLYPQSDNSFFTKERDLVFEFVVDAKGKPLKIILKENNALADELIFENKQ